MKLVMINDCAYVGTTLLKYLPEEIKQNHITRTRSFFRKTFGLLFKLIRTNGDIFHVHYLLQDCYLASRLNKTPLIGHAHGSDLRSSLNHPLWGRIVRHNLKNCNKILVSTPDILGIAKEYREDAEYLPNPVDSRLFFPKPLTPSKKKKVLIASNSNWKIKGTDIAIRALSKISKNVEVSIIQYGKDFQKTLSLASSMGLKLNILPKLSHEKIRQYYWESDIVIDRFALGSLGLISLEAISCGRPVLSWVSSKYPENKSFPLIDLIDEKIIAEKIINPPSNLWKRQYKFVKEYHNIKKITKHLLSIYNKLINTKE
jgi:glycosyltransferase involved in cell wall biosynthesis